MARKPQPGGDRNAWGLVLNEFLDTSHNPDGTIKPAGVQFAVSEGVETALGVQLQPAVEDAMASSTTLSAAVDTRVASDARISRVNTQRYDTRAYASIQAAIDDAESAGGGTVFVADSVPTAQTITLKDGVYLTGRGVGATTVKVNTVTGTGSVAALPALSANVSKNARSVTFAAAHGLVPGDVFIIYNPTDYSFSPARPVYRNGEFCQVVGVSGTTVDLANPLYSGHTAAAVNLYKMTPIRTGISGMTIEGTAGVTAVKVEYGTDLVFRDLVIHGSNVSNLTISRCYNVSIDGFRAYDFGPLLGTNYGITISNSQRIRINHVDLETRRHGLATGGDDTVCSVPVRDVIIADSRISGRSELVGVCGCNLHGNAEHIRLDNVTMPNGFNPGGDYITVRNCDISTAPWGTAIDAPELCGYNITIENNVIRATNEIHSSRGLVYLPFGTANRPNGVTRIKNNFFDFDVYRTPDNNHMAIYTVMQGTNTTGIKVLEVDGNMFRSLQAGATYSWSVRVNTDTGGATWNEIYFRGNRYSGTHFTFERNATTELPYFEDEGNFLPAFPAKRGSVFRRRGSGGPLPVLYVNENSTSTWKAVATV